MAGLTDARGLSLKNPGIALAIFLLDYISDIHDGDLVICEFSVIFFDF